MSAPEVFSSIAALRAAIREARSRGLVALVPTMGALHEGHLSLVRAARAASQTVVVSIFVNPTQFGPNEDYSRYPRTFERDLKLLEQEGVAIVFAPTVEEMYPEGDPMTVVEVREIGDRLDGRTRVGHFRGVATVVAKLFNIVQPDLAYFGQKDAAQVAVLRAMVRDLNFPVELIVGPTVRDVDGLALSSRNQYLSPEQREQSLVLHRALSAAAAALERGNRDAKTLRDVMVGALQTEPAAIVEYVEVVDPATLEVIAGEISGSALLAIAAKIGTTRLIDNVVVTAAEEGVLCG